MYKIEDYIQIFQEILGMDRDEDIRNADCEGTQEWDSYIHLELVAAIEDKFQIRFSGEEVLEFLSFKEGLRILKEKGILCEG